MKRTLALVGLISLASCDGGEQSVRETETSALTTSILPILFGTAPCDDRQTSEGGEWYTNACKTQCANAATGVSSTPAGPFEHTNELACGDGAGADLSLSAGYTLRFALSDDRRIPSQTGDWATNLIKGECDNYSAITGIATDSQNHCNSGILCTQPAYGVDGARCKPLASPPGFTAVAQFCIAKDFTNTNALEPGASGNWDSAPNTMGECGPGRFLKGIAHGRVGNGAGRAVKILCCQRGFIANPG